MEDLFGFGGLDDADIDDDDGMDDEEGHEEGAGRLQVHLCERRVNMSQNFVNFHVM